MPEYIPEKSAPNIQQALAGLTELADTFDGVARKQQSSWRPAQRRAAEVYQELAVAARDEIVQRRQRLTGEIERELFHQLR